MKIAVFESIMTPAGHEIEFDRIVVEELKALGHEVVFYVPSGHVFQFDYRTPITYLPGRVVSYTGASKIKKIWLSAKREVNRLRWYRALLQAAKRGEFDAIIVPTSTYRYFRSLALSALKNTPVPLLFIVHGVNPSEAGKFFKNLDALRNCKNLNAVVLTFSQSVFGTKHPLVSCCNPPVYTPRDLIPQKVTIPISSPQAVKLGFFGQYRKEKRLDVFLDAFLSCNFTAPVELMIQGATVRPDDAADFERIQQKYSHHRQLTFLHKALIGREWQEAIVSVDALVMPYGAERYRYHWAGMLFTAIGYHKPVLLTDDINPEVFQAYDIGESFPAGDYAAMTQAMERFVNTYTVKAAGYATELERANTDFSPRRFAQTLVSICGDLAGKL